MARTLMAWRKYVAFKKSSEPVSGLHPQALVVGGAEYKAAMAAAEKIGDPSKRKRISALFNSGTKYEALDAILSPHELGRTDPDVALEIAEAVAGKDFALDVRE